MNTKQTDRFQFFLQWGLGGLNIIFFLGILTSLAFSSVDIVLSEEKISATATKESSATIISESSLLPIQQLGYIEVEETPVPTPIPTPVSTPLASISPVPIVVSVKKNGSGGGNPLVLEAIKNSGNTEPSFHSSAPDDTIDQSNSNSTPTPVKVPSPEVEALESSPLPHVPNAVSPEVVATVEAQRIQLDLDLINEEKKEVQTSSLSESDATFFKADSSVLLDTKNNTPQISDIVPISSEIYEEDFVDSLSLQTDPPLSFVYFEVPQHIQDDPEIFHSAPFDGELHSSSERVTCSWILFLIIFFLGMIAEYIFSLILLPRKYDT